MLLYKISNHKIVFINIYLILISDQWSTDLYCVENRSAAKAVTIVAETELRVTVENRTKFK